ncbi:MAG: hypothetical protein ACLR2E_09345 [Lachnospiraceae bacterium]
MNEKKFLVDIFLKKGMMTPSYEAPERRKRRSMENIRTRPSLPEKEQRIFWKNDTEGKGRPAEPAALRFPYL